ncbi:MAG: septal ring lytic transglycosylase RlpA family protein [Hyphomicrobiales bacterium]
MKLRTVAGAIMLAGALAFGANLTTADAGSKKGKSFTGVASWYKMGKVTANGEAYRPNGLTAAHRYLPFGTKVRVKNLRNGRSVVLRINDRGPFVGKRVIDVSLGAARKLGMLKSGLVKVRVDVL